MKSTISHDEILAEQLRLLYKNSPIPVAVSVVVAAVVCWSLWDVADIAVLSIWFAAVAVTSVARVASFSRFNRSADFTANTAYWYQRFLAGTYLSALLWGASVLLVFPDDSPIHQSIFTIIIGGLTAGAVASLCANWPAILGFLVLALAPLAVKYLTLGSDYSLMLASVVVLFLATTLFGARRVHDNIRENIQLRLDSGHRERILKASEARYRHIFSNAPLGVCHYDAGSRIIDCNDVFAQILGTRSGSLIANRLSDILTGDQLLLAIQTSLEQGQGFYEGDFTSAASAKRTPVRAFFHAIRSTDDSVVGAVAIVEDLTERKQSEAQIRYQASYDQLTGLPNRGLLLEYLSREFSRAARHQRCGALLFIDLDNFKTINESLGHSVGDELLKLVAERISSALRREDTLARMGGDEFVVLLPDLADHPELAAKGSQHLAERLIETLKRPFPVAGQELHVTASIGMALFPAEHQRVDDILKQADTAMYRAKAAGRNTLRFFLPGMQQAADARLSLDTELRKALSNDELSIHYQPQTDIEGAIIGAEALVRWIHPERGTISPGEFIPIAEETGIIRDIGIWVLKRVCLRIKRWTDEGCLSPDQTISVNISPMEFSSSKFVERVTSILRETGADPVQLDLELTEGSLLTNVNETVEKINALRLLGIRFSIDDFGTGYSSLSYLKKLPLNKLKIDQSFVRDITSNSGGAAIVETIIMMAHNLGLDVIAEGVETEQELAYLHARECHVYQGYYFSKPLPENPFQALLQDGFVPVNPPRSVTGASRVRQERA